MRKIIFLILVIQCLFFPCFGYVVINEVMPNPKDNCSDCTEWVELYTNQINPSNLILDSGGKNTSFNCTSSFVIITKNKNTFLNMWMINESRVIEGNLSLNNEGAKIILYQNGDKLDNLSYPKVGENKTYARLSNGNWTECSTPTPGEPNNCTEQTGQENTKLTVYLEGILLTNILYNNLFKIEIENKENCSVKDYLTIQYNISNSTNIIKESEFTREIGCSGYANTGNWTPNQPGNFTICGKIINASVSFNNTSVCKNISVIDSKTITCDLDLKIYTPFIWYKDNGSEYYIFVNDSFGNYSGYPMEITYWIEDFFGNYIKNPYTTSAINTDENTSRSYTPKIECGTAVYWIKANITNPYCNDTNLSNNFKESLIGVTGSEECEACPEPEIKYETKYVCTTSSSETGSSLKFEILNLTEKLARNQEFITTVKLNNNFAEKISFEIYSYAYQGSKCITGSWTSNKKEISLNEDEEKIINLTNKIKEDAEPGEYLFRVRAKIDDENFDLTEKILVTNEIIENKTESDENIIEEPNLKIWTDSKLRINLSNCGGCKMIIVGPDISIITSKKYRVFEDFGKYEIFVSKEEIILNQTYLWDKEQNLTEESQPENESKITGKFLEVDTEKFIDKLLSTLQNLFSPVIKLMENSIR